MTVLFRPNRLRLALTLVVVVLMAVLGIRSANIETDITRSLPTTGGVFSDAAHIFAHHPLQGEVAIDIGVAHADPDALVAAAERVEQRLRDSGLFARVGMEAMGTLVPELLAHIVAHLPVLFTRQDLEVLVAPRISADAVRRRIAGLREELMSIEAIGTGRFVARDPLALRYLVLARLSQRMPSGDVVFHRGRLLSADRKHLLLVATPLAAGADTAAARKIETLMSDITEHLSVQGDPGNPVTLSPVGAYRAALDNERIIRHDVQVAVGVSTLGIALLLLLAFPRPLLGLFAFLPAAAGTAAAFFCLALFYRSLSIMAVGFGGAIIAITVDHGIAYLLFLGHGAMGSGRAAAREVRAIGLMAAVTTVGGFCALWLTGFPVFVQLGQFAALGIAFSFLFVHMVFPGMFSGVPVLADRPCFFGRGAWRLPKGGKRAAWAAAGFGVAMLCVAAPRFDTRLSAMNTVSEPTERAQQLMAQVWGSGMFTKLFFMTEADSLQILQERGDYLLATFSEDMAADRVAGAFLPAMLFPGAAACQANFAAWRAFWTPDRQQLLERQLAAATADGFAPGAFAPFTELVSRKAPTAEGFRIPEAMHGLMGVTRADDGRWMQFTTITPGPAYAPEAFRERYGNAGRIFDPDFFSRTLGTLLFSSFVKMVLIVGGAVALLLFVFFLDVRLALICLAPVVFALVCTLGTLRLAGRVLDIPAVMLAIIVFGMGVDYSLYLVRSRQRYGTGDHPGVVRIQGAVLLAAASTLIGFGMLCFSDHALLRSAGISSFLGVLYALLGAFLLLPPLLDHYFSARPKCEVAALPMAERIAGRYRHMEPYPRLFARFKYKTDRMFSELPDLLKGRPAVRTAVDIGCGFGVPGCWVLEHYPGARVIGLDPDPERVRVAQLAMGPRGEMHCQGAPQLPQLPKGVDAAFLLDMTHFLDDAALVATLTAVSEALHPGGVLVIRAVVPAPDGRVSWLWKIDRVRMRLAGITPFHRTGAEMIRLVSRCGFAVESTRVSGGNPELLWLVASPAMKGDAA